MYILHKNKIAAINTILMCLMIINFGLMILTLKSLFMISYVIILCLVLGFNLFLILTKKKGNIEYKGIRSVDRKPSSHWAAIEKRKFEKRNKNGSF